MRTLPEVAAGDELQSEQRNKIVVDYLDIHDGRLGRIAVNAFDQHRSGIAALPRRNFHTSAHAGDARLAGELIAECLKLVFYLIGNTGYGDDLFALHAQVFVEDILELVIGNERASDQQD